MTRFFFLFLMIITLTACSFGQSDEPFPPGTKVEMVCQRYCDSGAPGSGGFVSMYESPGSRAGVGGIINGAPAEILENDVIDDVLFYKIRTLTLSEGWVRGDEVTR